jgi:hypothetical protein
MNDAIPGADAAAFAAHEAIRSGQWDRHLNALGWAIRQRTLEIFAERELVRGGANWEAEK